MAAHSSVLAWRLHPLDRGGRLQPMGFPGQEYWSELPCPPPGDHPDPGIESEALMFLALAGRFFTTSDPCEEDMCKKNISY